MLQNPNFHFRFLHMTLAISFFTSAVNSEYCISESMIDLLYINLYISDLLGKGRTSGQTIRYLADPNLRRKEELDEIAKAKEEKKTAEKKKGAKPDKGGKADKAGKNAKEKGGKEAASKAGSGTDEEGESTRPGTPLEEPLPIERTWFTTVCYGLPNYIIMPQSGAKR